MENENFTNGIDKIDKSLTEITTENTSERKPRNEKDVLRGEMEDLFREKTGLPLPPNKGKRNKLWYTPIKDFCVLVDWQPDRAKNLLRRAIVLQGEAGLDIFSPASIEKMFGKAYAEESGHVKTEKPLSQEEWLRQNVGEGT